MKLILKEEVDNLGLPGDVVDVADGYGRNFLIPRGLAMLASRGAMKDAEAITRSRKAREAKTVGAAEAYRDALQARTLRVPVRVDEHGRLYGSVSSADVQRVLKERGHEVERRRIDLRHPIKDLGSHEVPIRIHPQVTATITLEVVDVEGKVRAGAAEEPERTIEEQALDAAAAADAAAEEATAPSDDAATPRGDEVAAGGAGASGAEVTAEGRDAHPEE